MCSFIRRISTAYLLVFLTGTAVICQSEGVWTLKADMPTARTQLSCSVVNGKIYAIGGSVGPPSWTALSTVEIYDPVSDEWSAGTDMTTARGALTAGVVNDTIYVIGGTYGAPTSWSPLVKVDVYDSSTDSWTDGTAMPEPRSHPAGCVLNNKIYVIGGTYLGGSLPGLSKNEEFDPLATAIKIHYLGHSAFVLQFDNGIIIVTDYGHYNAWASSGWNSPIYGIGDTVPDVMTHSHHHADHYDPGRIPDGVEHILTGTDSLTIDGIEIKPIRTCEHTVGVEDNTSYLLLEYFQAGICSRQLN